MLLCRRRTIIALPSTVLLVARHAELGHQRIDPVLARPDPGAAAVDPDTVVADLGERATADPVTGLQQRHRIRPPA